MAFSVINKHYSSSYVPDDVRIMLQFSSSDVYGVGEWARFEIVATKEDYDFENNRYVVATKEVDAVLVPFVNVAETT